MPLTVSRYRVMAYTVPAAVVLILGARLRPEERTAAGTPAEAVTLQAMTLREELHRAATFLFDHALARAKAVTWVAQAGASGVSWDSNGTLVAPTSSDLLQPFLQTSPTLAPAKAGLQPAGSPRWLVLVARNEGGALLWTAGLRSGLRPATCEGFAYQELITNIPLQAAFRGGALFDLEGALNGIVAQCGERMTIVPAAEVERALAWAGSTRRRLVETVGFHAGAGKPPGAPIVSEVRVGSRAQRAGLEPGDTLLALDDRPVARIDDLEPLLTAGPHVLQVSRQGRKVAISFPPAPAAGPGWEIERPGALLAWVAPGSRADRAGLRAGDQILRVAGKPAKTGRTLERAGKSVAIVYRRDGVDRITALPE